MTKRGGLGSLADLAKILEAATDPNSEVREDRKENKPAEEREPRQRRTTQQRAVDPKRKAWYQKRLSEQAAVARKEAGTQDPEGDPTVPKQAITRTAASALGTSVLETLAAAKSAKTGQEKESKRPEAWRRKPGDPVF